MLKTINAAPPRNRRTTAAADDIKAWVDHNITNETHGFIILAVQVRNGAIDVAFKRAATPDTVSRQHLAEIAYRAVLGKSADPVDAVAIDVLMIGGSDAAIGSR